MKTILRPMRVTNEYFITNGDQEGVATMKATALGPLTDAEIAEQMNSLKEKMPEGFRFMTHGETVNFFLHEEGHLEGDVTVVPPRLKDNEVWFEDIK